MNPLKPTDMVLVVTPEEEEAIKGELLEDAELSLFDLQQRKVAIARTKELLELDSKEKNLLSVAELNENIDSLMRLVADPSLAETVAMNIETGKDYNEFVKAVSAVSDLRDKLLDKTGDFNDNHGKKKRIVAQFQTQGVKVSMGVEIDE